jgi:hypothetical protein
MLATVLAHQGGWDEILMVATPMALFGGLMWLANRRANAEVARRNHEAETPVSPDGDVGP